MRKYLLLLVLAVGGLANAESFSLVCDFEKFASEDGVEKVKDEFVLTFLFDLDAEKVFMIGNQGTSELMLVANQDDAVTLLEMTPTGNVMLTTIVLSTGQAVHSRQPVMLGEIIPSQYYGSCETRD